MRVGLELRTHDEARCSRDLVFWDATAILGPDLSNLDDEKVFPEVRVEFGDHLAVRQVLEPFANIVGSLVRVAVLVLLGSTPEPRVGLGASAERGIYQ